MSGLGQEQLADSHYESSISRRSSSTEGDEDEGEGPDADLESIMGAGRRSASLLNLLPSSQHKRWRRQAQRRALRHGASFRNSYLVHPTACTQRSGAEQGEIGETSESAFSSTSRSLTSAPRAGAAVQLHVYDLRTAKDINNATHSLGFGVFHAGVEVFGVEWGFGFTMDEPPEPAATGVYPVDPRKCPVGDYRESLCLGPTSLGAHDVWMLLERLAGRWLGREYHPLRRNCVHFCTDLCQHLGVCKLPAWVGRLAEAADTVLTPFFDLDFKVPAEANGGKRTSGRTSVSQHSFATAIALEFENQFAWSLAAMLAVEAKGLRGSLSTASREDLSAFL